MKRFLVLVFISMIVFSIQFKRLSASNNLTIDASSQIQDYITSSNVQNFFGQNQQSTLPPLIKCFETSTNSGSSMCSGIPGGDGMRGVCSAPGCYDRAKIEIATQDNNQNIKYAIQIATNPSFTTGVKYISGANRIPKDTLTSSDFLYTCEWEGTINSVYCKSANATYQKYNIFGLKPETLYYVRVVALNGITGNAEFILGDWSPSATAITQNSTIYFNVETKDINTSSSDTIYQNEFTSTNNILVKTTTNVLNGIEVSALKQNAQLNEWEIINIQESNSSDNIDNLGKINIQTDLFAENGINKLNELHVKYVTLFNSNLLPLYNGVSGYKFISNVSHTKPEDQTNQVINVFVASLN